jgi:hypothetical protein
MDHTRSKGFWINPPARHAVIARRCLQLLQLKGTWGHSSYDLIVLCFVITTSHCEKAETTPELRHDLIGFSLNNLQRVFNNMASPPHGWVFTFIPLFLSGLKNLVWYCSFHILFWYLYDL